MKRIFIKLSLFALFLSACTTDFDVNAEWQETTVVYGLLDASMDTQYIKINKAYLGEGDAIMMAQYSDSINFIPNELEVKLHKLLLNDTLVSIILDTTLILKDSLDVNGESGIFSNDNNIIYRAVVPNGFLRDDCNYAITIKNIYSGNEVSSNTEVISNFSFKDFNSAYKFGFYNPSSLLVDSLQYLSKTIKWNKSKNGVIYQLDVIFNYIENGDRKSLVWSQQEEVYEGSISMQSKLEGIQFFNFLRQNLSDDNNVTRSFLNLDLLMTVATENLNTYIKVNEPLAGIVQQKPQFTNINNGSGIFSSRYSHSESNIGLTDNTMDFLINKLNRNFE